MMISSNLQTKTEEQKHLNENNEMLNRIGQLTRTLHENLRGIGLDQIVEKISKDIPDACERLQYVSRMTEQSAERVLNATDVAIPLQTKLSTGTESLRQYWEDVIEKPSLKTKYNETVKETLAVLVLANQHSTETKALLLEIMMAQDFQDLTGQVIKKVIAITQELEYELVQILIDFAPKLNTPVKTNSENDSNLELLNESKNSKSTVDSIANQQQVDHLLDSLGF